MRRRGVSPPLPSPPRGGEAAGLRPPLRRGRGRGRSGRIFAAFAAFSRILSPFIAPKARKTPEPAEKNRFSVDPGLFCVYPHTQFGLLRRLRGSGGRPCGLSPPRAPPCRLLFRRAAPRACGVVAVEGVSSRPPNKGRCAPSPGRACRAFQRPANPSPDRACRAFQRPANPSPDPVCRAFQRPANPSPRHDITRPTQQNVQVILLRWERELQRARKIAGCYSVISDTG